VGEEEVVGGWGVGYGLGVCDVDFESVGHGGDGVCWGWVGVGIVVLEGYCVGGRARSWSLHMRL
jgi:hypothetical protein